MILTGTSCITQEACGSLSSEADAETSGRAVWFLPCRDNHVRLWIALAGSLALHLAVIALLAAFIQTSGNFSGQLTGFFNAPLTVSISKSEKRSQSVSPAPRQQVSMQATNNPGTHIAAWNPAQDGMASSRHIGLPGLYFSTSELDVIPEIRRDIDLYPSELHNHEHHGGKIVLRLWIDEAGLVAKAEPVSSNLPAIFAEVATRAFMQADFLPGRKNGLAVKSKVEAALFYPSRDSRQ